MAEKKWGALVAARYVLPSDITVDWVVGDLSKRFDTLVEAKEKTQYAFLDSFDWRLYNAGLVLYQVSEKLALRPLMTNGIWRDGTFAGESSTMVPHFYWDLPHGHLREQLSSILEVRALLTIAQVEVTSTTVRVLNKEQKTVARVEFQSIVAASEEQTEQDPPEVFLQIAPVRGYPKYAHKLADHFDDMGLLLSGIDPYLLALSLAGQNPGDYSSELDIQLQPDLRSDIAAKVILRQLFSTMRTNEPYIAQDIDTEFLHDFRVAVRKTRSALSQIKSVFPAQETSKFKRGFRAIGKLTNELRDLDVYLLDEPYYKSQLPLNFQDDIEPLFDYMRFLRERALVAVSRGLESDPYRLVMADWQEFLGQDVPGDASAVNAELPVLELANKRIYRHYRHILRSGKLILRTNDDEQMHALRIECKKLRYLLEFFSTLYPAKKIAYLTGQLKRLQRNLGRFNDYSVQQEYLLHIADELPLDDERGRRALIATGALVRTLESERLRVKEEFAVTFKAFASEENQKLFRKLFAKNKKSKKGRKRAK